MRVYLKSNNSAKFHHDPIWNDGAALGFFRRASIAQLNKKNNNNKYKNKMSCDVRSVPAPDVGPNKSQC